MKVQFKDVGATLSTNDYNAICYLLQQEEYKEVIVLDTTAWHGGYGIYKVQDLEGTIARTHDGFRVTNKNNHFSIIIKNDYTTADLYVTLNVMRQKTVVINGQSVVLYPDDRIDNTFDENLRLEFKELRLKAVPYHDDLFVIDIYPVQHDLKVGDFISKIALFELDYSKPLINVSDGGYVEGSVICYDFEQLKSVIKNSASDEDITVKLKGDTTYTVDEELTIGGKRKVTIYGGNAGHNSVLDGQKLYRLFTVRDEAYLELHNLDLVNGNGSKINKNTDQHKTGGAIYMISQYGNTGDNWVLLAPTVRVYDCNFINCQANMGGAIYNLRGKLSCVDCNFTNCDAIAPENPSGAFGGAIVNQSIRLYNDSTNQIYIDPSDVVINQDGVLSLLYLNIHHTQNLQFFKDDSFSLPDTMKLYCNGTIKTCYVTKISQFQYNVRVSLVLHDGDSIYLYAPNFSPLPNLCTRVLKIVKNSDYTYTARVED